MRGQSVCIACAVEVLEATVRDDKGVGEGAHGIDCAGMVHILSRDETSVVA